METLRNISTWYKEWDEKNADLSLAELPLSDSPKATIIIITSYLIIILTGPTIMKNRQPWNLQKFIGYYNICQIITTAVVIMMEFTRDRPLMCGKHTRSLVTKYDATTLIAYLNFALRIPELIETIIFVLRKKNRQISFLHVYHHCYNLAVAWCGQRYKADGTVASGTALNFMVHFLMYSYYYASSSNSPFLQKFASTVKKHLTQIQLVQFLLLACIFSGDYIFENCGPPNFVNLLCFLHFLLLSCLFMNFYVKTYFAKKPKRP